MMPTESPVMAPLASLSGALLVIGLPFTMQWERAKGTDPASFGSVVAAFVIVALVLAFVAGASVPHWRGRLVSFELLSVAAGSVVVIASRSGTITAEGMLVAMLLPVGLLAVGVAASVVDAGLASRVKRADVRTLLVLATLAVLSAVVAWRFPVVQFLPGARAGEIHPVQGSWLAFAGGVMAGAIAGPVWRHVRWHWSMLLMPAAGVLGYTLQASFGAALAMLGVWMVMPEWRRHVRVNSTME
jgi:hypothetical protein